MTPDVDARPLALEKNNIIYEALRSQLDRKRAEGPEAALRHVERMSEFALHHHPGRFADGAVEDVAFRIGRSLDEAPAGTSALDARIRGDARPKMLHVANRVHALGGHTRIICKCIATDAASVHVLVLTDQHDAIPSFLSEIVERAGGQIIVLATQDTMVERARQLRSIARVCDRVFIVTYPQDPIPVVAFAADDLPPVALSNHAQFSFGLGSTVADLVVNHVPYHLEAVTRPFRSARHAEMLLCFPGLAPFDPPDKAAAKRALGFSDDDVVLLAMAFPSYWVPNQEYDFFRTARRILELDPRVHILMVGPDPGDPNVLRRVPDSPRFQVRGPSAEPAAFFQAADAALESFPVPSPGSLGEAVAYGGAYPIPKYGRGESILCFDLPVVSTFVKRARDENAYVAQLKRFLAAVPEHRRRASEIREALIAFDRAGPARLQAMYARLEAIGHQPREIPAAFCSRAADSQAVAEINFGPWARPATLTSYVTVPEFSPVECRYYYHLAAEQGCFRAEDMADTLADIAAERASADVDLRGLRHEMDVLGTSLRTVEDALQERSSQAVELEHRLGSSREALTAQRAAIGALEEMVRQHQAVLEHQLRSSTETLVAQHATIGALEEDVRRQQLELERQLRSSTEAFAVQHAAIGALEHRTRQQQEELEHQGRSSTEAQAAQHTVIAVLGERLRQQQLDLCQQQQLLKEQDEALRAQHESIALQGARLERFDRHWAVRLYRGLRSPGRALRAWRLRAG